MIETKTFGKRPGKNDQIYFRDGEVRADGVSLTRDPVQQVTSTAKWVGEVLEQSTGRKFPIRPVLLFPGWYVHSSDHSKIWVLSPKALPKFIENERLSLSQEDVKLAVYHLSRHIRTS